MLVTFAAFKKYMVRSQTPRPRDPRLNTPSVVDLVDVDQRRPVGPARYDAAHLLLVEEQDWVQKV